MRGTRANRVVIRDWSSARESYGSEAKGGPLGEFTWLWSGALLGRKGSAAEIIVGGEGIWKLRTVKRKMEVVRWGRGKRQTGGGSSLEMKPDVPKADDEDMKMDVAVLGSTGTLCGGRWRRPRRPDDFLYQGKGPCAARLHEQLSWLCVVLEENHEAGPHAPGCRESLQEAMKDEEGVKVAALRANEHWRCCSKQGIGEARGGGRATPQEERAQGDGEEAREGGARGSSVALRRANRTLSQGRGGPETIRARAREAHRGRFRLDR